MFVFLTVVYVLVCLFLIFVVLLQPGRGGMGGAFGGGASSQVFGGAGATDVLKKMTAVSATIFMLLSVVLAYLSSSDSAAVEAAYEREAAETRSTTSMSEAATSESEADGEDSPLPSAEEMLRMMPPEVRGTESDEPAAAEGDEAAEGSTAEESAPEAP